LAVVDNVRVRWGGRRSRYHALERNATDRLVALS